MKWKIWLNMSPNMTPAAPASTEPMKKVDAIDAVDVDSHHRRGLAVERGRAHRLPEPRPRDEEREADHQEDGGREHHELDELEVHAWTVKTGSTSGPGSKTSGLAAPSWNDS